MTSQALQLTSGSDKRERRVILFVLVGIVACVAGGFLVLDSAEDKGIAETTSKADAAGAASSGAELAESGTPNAVPRAAGMMVRSKVSARVQGTVEQSVEKNVEQKETAQRGFETVVSVGASPEYLVQELRRHLEELEALAAHKQLRLESTLERCAGNCSEFAAALELEHIDLQAEIVQTRERLAAVTTESNEATHEIVFGYGAL